MILQGLSLERAGSLAEVMRDIVALARVFLCRRAHASTPSEASVEKMLCFRMAHLLFKMDKTFGYSLDHYIKNAECCIGIITTLIYKQET